MRKDGKRVKCDSLEYAVVPHVMVERCDSMNMIELDIPEAPIHEYLNEKRKQGIHLSHLSVVIAAYTRTLGEYPQLNRFIVNKRIYARNEFAVGMVVLKAGKTDNGTMSKVNLDPADNIFEVNDKMMAYIDKNRDETDENATDKLAGTLLKIPGLLRVGVAVLKWMDKHGLLPRAIIDASPFHASLTVTNLASIRTNHIFHHVYNFGTTGILISMGNLREIPHSDKDGGIKLERCLPLGVVMDERICSGSYYAKAFRTMSKYLANPVLLEEKPDESKVIREVPYREDKL